MQAGHHEPHPIFLQGNFPLLPCITCGVPVSGNASKCFISTIQTANRLGCTATASTPLRKAFGDAFLRIFRLPFTSALRNRLPDARYSPRLTRRPEKVGSSSTLP